MFALKSGNNADVPADMPTCIQVKRVLPVAVAFKPGFAAESAKRAEPSELVQDTQICARGQVVARAEIVVDFQVGRGNGQRLGVAAKPLAAAGAALKVRYQNPLAVAGVAPAAPETHLP
jgi:hypothetical protein